MINDPEVAKQISELMLECGKKLDQSVKLVVENCTKQELFDYRRAVAKIMGNMLTEIMNPLYETHPDLKPKELL
jgi:hypothetical protein